ncbi:MAG: site-2 protease family protein [bacterium]
MQFLITALTFVIALCIHEFSHAYVADKLGDPTPRSYGRLTLDPRAHLDLLGTLAIIFIGFGWAKPVPIDAYNLRNPKRDMMFIALAGPVSNLLLAVVMSLIIKVIPASFFSSLLMIMAYSNIGLAIFNLIPVFPLDGEKILTGLLPTELATEFGQIMHQYGTIILVLMLLPIAGGTSPISALISPAISFVAHLLL